MWRASTLPVQCRSNLPAETQCRLIKGGVVVREGRKMRNRTADAARAQNVRRLASPCFPPLSFFRPLCLPLLLFPCTLLYVCARRSPVSLIISLSLPCSFYSLSAQHTAFVRVHKVVEHRHVSTQPAAFFNGTVKSTHA